ncbi:MAG: tetratricopeptide repeat protein [Anaerolineae bacterium]|nr:tetratricopeptide repeat protein [Anaerolineae bacterium]
MGAVYRATDRLTGEAVALKRVTTPAEQLTFASRGEKTDPPLALAQEFRTLASLHHPNVIRVLDYGFDEQRCPFFTMTLLENAQTLVGAGQAQDVATRVDLLVQTLQALAYLHRRNTLHRDLKPGNVLVVDGHVQVLDFGVSVTTSRTMQYLTQTMTGTLAYLAPELFQGAPVTRASDLYAVGVMAYELLAGRYPYNDANMAVLITDILTKAVEVHSIGLGGELAEVLGRLLAKSAEERYDDAGDVIRDLCAATGCSLPRETIEIRESYLQAARFVGREAELRQLSQALDFALEGRGSAWLLGGESGVGKSRLCDELRTLALVGGATVLRGQAVSVSGNPYHLWRDALRWLTLTSDLELEETSVLKPLAPDIADLVGHDVPDAPPLDPQAAQARLHWVVAKAFGRQDRPVVVILEDLQWAGSESLALLEHLTRGIADLSLMLVGNYRDDESPHLPKALPGMHVLRLERLSTEHVAELSASMMGSAGHQEQVVGLLQRESEGNPFFLVEIARALAEEAGRLEDIGYIPLPDKVFAGGVLDVIRRRISRVPMEARPPLLLAAVAGRELDLEVLGTLVPELDVSRWLTICADVAVLEVAGGQWRFSHHRLRDGVVDALPESEQRELHRQVALAIEKVYPEAEEQIVALAYHWEEAGNLQKGMAYLLRAGDQARAAYANEEAVGYYRRALQGAECLPPSETLAQQQAAYESSAEVLSLLGRYDEAIEHYASARALTEVQSASSDRDRHLADLCRRVADVYEKRSEYDAALHWLERGLSYLEDGAPSLEMARIHLLWAGICHRLGDNEQAITRCRQCLDIALQVRTREGQRTVARAYYVLGLIHWRRGDLAQAMQSCRDSVGAYQEIGDSAGLARAASNLASVTFAQGNWSQAVEHLLYALRMAHTVGDVYLQALATLNLGDMYLHQGNLDQASVYNGQSLEMWERLGSTTPIALLHNNMAMVALRRGRADEALSLLQESLRLFARVGSSDTQPEVHRNLAEAHLSRGEIGEALRAAERSVSMARERAMSVEEGQALHVLGEIHMAQGELALAGEALRQSVHLLADAGSEYETAGTRLSLARLAAREGSTAKARMHLRQAIEVFRRLGARIDLAQASSVEAQLGHEPQAL